MLEDDTASYTCARAVAMLLTALPYIEQIVLPSLHIDTKSFELSVLD